MADPVDAVRAFATPGQTEAPAVDLTRIGKLDTFEGSDEEWPGWSFTMIAYIGALGLFTMAQLNWVTEQEDAIPLSSIPAHLRRNAGILFYVLVMYLRGLARNTLRRVEPHNGLEAWRMLSRRYRQDDGTSSLGRLKMILDYNFGSGPGYLNTLATWLVLIKDYNEANPLDELSESVLKTILIKGAPQPLKAHLEVTGSRMSYKEILGTIESFVRSQREWHPDSAPNAFVPMEVDQLYWLCKGKGKGKGKEKFGKGKDKGKFAGKSVVVGVTPDPCWRCGQPGHGAATCTAVQTPEDLSQVQCWLCQGWGHRARHCPNRWSNQGEGLQLLETMTAPRPTISDADEQLALYEQEWAANVLLPGEEDDMDAYGEMPNESEVDEILGHQLV